MIAVPAQAADKTSSVADLRSLLTTLHEEHKTDEDVASALKPYGENTTRRFTVRHTLFMMTYSDYHLAETKSAAQK